MPAVAGSAISVDKENHTLNLWHPLRPFTTSKIRVTSMGDAMGIRKNNLIMLRAYVSTLSSRKGNPDRHGIVSWGCILELLIYVLFFRVDFFSVKCIAGGVFYGILLPSNKSKGSSFALSQVLVLSLLPEMLSPRHPTALINRMHLHVNTPDVWRNYYHHHFPFI